MNSNIIDDPTNDNYAVNDPVETQQFDAYGQPVPVQQIEPYSQPIDNLNESVGEVALAPESYSQENADSTESESNSGADLSAEAAALPTEETNTAMLAVAQNYFADQPAFPPSEPLPTYTAPNLSPAMEENSFQTTVIPAYQENFGDAGAAGQQLGEYPIYNSALEDMTAPAPINQNSQYQNQEYGGLLPDSYAPATILPSVEVDSPERAKRRRRNKILLVILLILLILVSVGGYCGYRYLKATYGPEQAVERYLKAIVSADAATAAKIYSPAGNPEDNILLRNDIYEKAKLRPSGYEITEVNEDKKQAKIQVKLVINGKSYPLTISMKDTSENFILPDWHVEKADFGFLEFVSMPNNLVVNGVKVDMSKVLVAHKDTESIKLPVFPGQYEIKGDSGSKYLSYGSVQTVQALPESKDGKYQEKNKLEFELKMTQDLEDELIRQVQDRLKGCMDNKEFTVPDCAHLNIKKPVSYTVTDIVRTWEYEPDYSVDDTLEKVSDGKYTGNINISDGDMRVDYKYRFDSDDDWNKDYTNYRNVFGYQYELTFNLEGDKLEIDWGGF